jgi:hypothetical protein
MASSLVSADLRGRTRSPGAPEATLANDKKQANRSNPQRLWNIVVIGTIRCMLSLGPVHMDVWQRLQFLVENATLP